MKNKITLAVCSGLLCALITVPAFTATRLLMPNKYCISVANPVFGGCDSCYSLPAPNCSSGKCIKSIIIPSGQWCKRCQPFEYFNCYQLTTPYNCPIATGIVGVCVVTVSPFFGIVCECAYLPGTPRTDVSTGLGNC